MDHTGDVPESSEDRAYSSPEPTLPDAPTVPAAPAYGHWPGEPPASDPTVPGTPNAPPWVSPTGPGTYPPAGWGSAAPDGPQAGESRTPNLPGWATASPPAGWGEAQAPLGWGPGQAPPGWGAGPPPGWSGGQIPPGWGHIPPGGQWWEARPPSPSRAGRVASIVVAILAIIAIIAAVSIQSGRSNSASNTVGGSNGSSGSLSPGSGGYLPNGNSGGFFPNGNGSSNGVSSSSGPDSAKAAAIAQKANPGVVDIQTRLGYQGAAAAGTGMVLTPDGRVLTNNHVISGATQVTATVASTGKTYTAKVVGSDATNDVALVQLQGASGLQTVSTGNSSSVAEGDYVVALGNAGGVGGAPSVASGNVTALNQTITVSDESGGDTETLSNLIEVNANLQPGDSGGPLVNDAAKVIGMNTAASAQNRFTVASGTGYAIPITKALGIVRQIESGTSSGTVHVGPTAFLGITVDPDPPSGRNSFAPGGDTGPYSSGGALVAQVIVGTPAASIGLQSGDTITSLAGDKVTSATSLTNLMRTHRPGEKVRVGWTDSNGGAHSATLTLTTGPAT